jgi:hypothetical protein
LFEYWSVEVLDRPDPERRSQVAQPSLLLGGYAIENYAKARLVEMGKTWPQKRGHDLLWLIQEAGWNSTSVRRRLSVGSRES